MAKGNLQELLNTLESSSKEREAYRNTVNTFEHQYSLDYDKLWKELVAQVSGLSVKDKNKVLILVEQDKGLEKELKRILKKYCVELYKRFSALASDPNYEVIIAGVPTKFTVNISSSRREDIFVKVIKNRIRSKPLKTLQKEVYDAIDGSILFSEIITSSKDPGHVQRTLEARTLGREYETKRLTKEGVPVLGRTSGLFELGHLAGSSVVEKWLRTHTEGLSRGLDSLPSRVIKETKAFAELRAYVKTDDINSKSIVVVYDQSTFSNKSQASIENKIVPKLTSLLNEALNSKGADFWANFETSPSVSQRIRDDLIGRAIKKGAKGVKPKKAGKSTAKASVTLKRTVNKTSSSESIKSKTKNLQLTPSKSESYKPNWLSLIPIINARLTEKVILNMKSPRLNNRTGRFAQSAKVINVEQTREGFPSFVFDYERDPYNVFDRTVGRNPWNTPERDPRALVDLSVREVVREMAIGRFFTRRAQ